MTPAQNFATSSPSACWSSENVQLTALGYCLAISRRDSGVSGGEPASSLPRTMTIPTALVTFGSPETAWAKLARSGAAKRTGTPLSDVGPEALHVEGMRTWMVPESSAASTNPTARAAVAAPGGGGGA